MIWQVVSWKVGLGLLTSHFTDWHFLWTQLNWAHHSLVYTPESVTCCPSLHTLVYRSLYQRFPPYRIKPVALIDLTWADHESQGAIPTTLLITVLVFLLFSPLFYLHTQYLNLYTGFSTSILHQYHLIHHSVTMNDHGQQIAWHLAPTVHPNSVVTLNTGRIHAIIFNRDSLENQRLDDCESWRCDCFNNLWGEPCL